MPPQTSWLQIVTECKNTLQARINPLLKTLKQPQPILGTGAGGDPMKKIDLAAEYAITSTLEKHGVSFTLISEETGISEHGENPHEAYVTTDPIDGTTNLTRGIPFYATSIAVSTKPDLNTVHTALVTDLFHNRIYTAEKGKGARRDNKKIVPSKNTSLEEAVIGMDINTFKIQKLIPRLTSIIERTKHIRHLGANALELCYVADGTTDAFIDIRGKLRTTDMAAGWLITQEAGGTITTPEGKPLNVKLDPKQKVEFVAAANPTIHEILLKLIRPEKEAK
jgi:myo-inositol-1(or 4)-monophosphatase